MKQQKKYKSRGRNICNMQYFYFYAKKQNKNSFIYCRINVNYQNSKKILSIIIKSRNLIHIFAIAKGRNPKRDQKIASVLKKKECFINVRRKI